MKKFLYVLCNTVLFTFGMLLTTNSELIRQFVSINNFAGEIAIFACILTIVVACVGIFSMISGIHGIIYQLTGFSLYNFIYRKFLTTEKTDN